MIYTADTLRSILKDTGPKPKKKAKNSRIVGIKTRKNFRRLNFLVRSKEEYSSSKGWISTIYYPKVNFRNLSPDLISPMEEEARVGCQCPAFQYWGSAYSSSDFGYNLPGRIETRFPEIRDPGQENLVCKHLVKAINYVSKRTFKQLAKRFKTGDLKTASIEDLYPSIGDFLRFNYGFDNEEVDDVLFSLTEDNLEDFFEEYMPF